MHLQIHSPTSEAHIEELQARLEDHLTGAPVDPVDRSATSAIVRTLGDVVRAMDRGSVPVDQARVLFACFRITGFDFDRWLAEMMDEGVYVDAPLHQAA